MKIFKLNSNVDRTKTKYEILYKFMEAKSQPAITVVVFDHVPIINLRRQSGRSSSNFWAVTDLTEVANRKLESK